MDLEAEAKVEAAGAVAAAPLGVSRGAASTGVDGSVPVAGMEAKRGVAAGAGVVIVASAGTGLAVKREVVLAMPTGAG